MKRILALAKYGREAASCRQRMLQYAPALAEAGFAIDFAPLLDDDYVRGMSSGRRPSVLRIAAAYARRLSQLRDAHSYDALWVYAEAFPYLSAAFERLVLRSGVPVVTDFDDAFFHGHARHWWLHDKMAPLLAGSARVIAGNAYLAAYARRWTDRVKQIPTVVDTDEWRPGARRTDGPPVIGWIGSPSTWAYVRPVLPLLEDLCASGRARFLAVGAGAGAAADRFEGMTLMAWDEASEIGLVQSMDIGIMPLPDEPWARGKCGYKLIQYMACGLPVVASPVGVNRDIVDDGVNGLLATGDSEWHVALESLVADPDRRRRFGEAGRAKAVESYSLARTAPEIVSLFAQLPDRWPPHSS